MDDIYKMAEVAAESVELPHDQGVSGSEGLEAGLQPRTIIALPAGHVAVDISLWHAGRVERILLEVERLRPIGFRNTHVADKG